MLPKNAKEEITSYHILCGQYLPETKNKCTTHTNYRPISFNNIDRKNSQQILANQMNSTLKGYILCPSKTYPSSTRVIQHKEVNQLNVPY